MLSQSFDPFGNVLDRAGVFGYTDEQTDPTALVYLRAKYYDPSIGRFLTADSIVPDPLKSGGWNGYIYVGNNPIAFTDPSGHCGPLENAGMIDGARDSIDTVCSGGASGSRSGSGTSGSAPRGMNNSTVRPY